MGSSLSLFRANVGALDVLLGALFSFPVNLSLSLCFSGHVICSLAVLLFLLLLHSSPNSDLMPTSCWPLTHIFIFWFFFLRLVVHFFFLFLCSWKPHLLKCDQNPSHRLCSQHPLGGGRWPSLSLLLFLSVTITLFYTPPLPLLLPFFSVVSLFFPSLLSLPSCLSACAWSWLSLLISPCVCMETPGWGVGVTLACCWRWRLKHCSAARPTVINKISLHGMHTETEPPVCLCSSSVICPMGGKKGRKPFFVNSDLCLLCSCMNVVVVLYVTDSMCKLCPSDGLFCVFLMSLWVLYKGQFDVVAPFIVNVLIV